MKTNYQVIITVRCSSAEDLVQARQAINYHLETLNPEFSIKRNCLTAIVPPLDTYFEPQEACDIIRLTLAQSLTPQDWKCTLHTIN